MTRPRAADDFGAIRARMEELRHEHAEVSPVQVTRRFGSRPYHATDALESGHRRHLPRPIRQRLFEQKVLGRSSPSGARRQLIKISPPG